MTKESPINIYEEELLNYKEGMLSEIKEQIKNLRKIQKILEEYNTQNNYLPDTQIVITYGKAGVVRNYLELVKCARAIKSLERDEVGTINKFALR